MQNHVPWDDLMSPVEAAAYVHLSVNTLAKMRSAGTSMPFLKVGRKKVFYRRADLDRWLATCLPWSLAICWSVSSATVNMPPVPQAQS